MRPAAIRRLIQPSQARLRPAEPLPRAPTPSSASRAAIPCGVPNSQTFDSSALGSDESKGRRAGGARHHCEMSVRRHLRFVAPRAGDACVAYRLGGHIHVVLRQLQHVLSRAAVLERQRRLLQPRRVPAALHLGSAPATSGDGGDLGEGGKRRQRGAYRRGDRRPKRASMRLARACSRAFASGTSVAAQSPSARRRPRMTSRWSQLASRRAGRTGTTRCRRRGDRAARNGRMRPRAPWRPRRLFSPTAAQRRTGCCRGWGAGRG